MKPTTQEIVEGLKNMIETLYFPNHKNRKLLEQACTALEDKEEKKLGGDMHDKLFSHRNKYCDCFKEERECECCHEGCSACEKSCDIHKNKECKHGCVESNVYEDCLVHGKYYPTPDFKKIEKLLITYAPNPLSTEEEQFGRIVTTLGTDTIVFENRNKINELIEAWNSGRN